MTLALLTGSLTVLVVAVGALWLHATPRPIRCPRCGEGTGMLKADPREPTEPAARRRHCPGCGWKGPVRLDGRWMPTPERAPEAPFRWGEERFPQDFGFHWAGGERPEAPQVEAPPPAHPSGFRFSSEDERADHPAGWSFRWGGEALGAGPGAAAPDPGSAAPSDQVGRPGFRWRAPEDRSRRGPPDFRWKHDGPDQAP